MSEFIKRLIIHIDDDKIQEILSQHVQDNLEEYDPDGFMNDSDTNYEVRSLITEIDHEPVSNGYEVILTVNREL